MLPAPIATAEKLPLPPTTETLMAPSFKKHDVAVVFAVKTIDVCWETVAGCCEVQPIVSLTVTIYIPAIRFRM